MTSSPPSGAGVWFTTDVGVVRFDGASTWTLYNKLNSGLPANVCNPLDFAPDGKLWVGCFDGQTFPYLGGVASFDGATWSTYTTANSPLPHNQIDSLAADASGNVWVGTASMGLAEILAGVNPSYLLGRRRSARPPLTLRQSISRGRITRRTSWDSKSSGATARWRPATPTPPSCRSSRSVRT